MITPIILSGGNGTRLWPLSRSHRPKQYLALINKNTLFQDTILRVNHALFNQPVVICNNEHRFLAAEQLQNINITPNHIVLETESKNTAAAIAVACLLQKNKNQLLLILPADHIITNLELFYKAIETASYVANQDKIITFGITPTKPEIKYGYIEAGEPLINHSLLYTVSKFIEKPDIVTAQKLLNSGKYYWNSGIFLFKTSTMLQELEKFQPNLLSSCQQAVLKANQDLDFLRLDSKLINSNPNNSIDYAVMEHTENAVVMPVALNWSDLGSWDSLWEIAPKDNNNNVLIGDIITKKTTNSYIRSENQLITVLGLNNIIVIATQDAILISPKDNIDLIKNITQELKIKDRTELDLHKQVYRPWGYYQTIDLSDRFQVKRIVVKPGAKTSTQIHYHRSEHWVIVEGTATVTKGEEILLLHENESIYLPMGVKHRIENPGKIPLHLIEVQSGAYLGEDDIVRLDDIYGRTTANTIKS
jgi:mannose-1-phosphate guanylyltransferase / mannose-6-phosphate isomerase